MNIEAKEILIVSECKTCPECGHQFQGNGWDGIDAHWRSKHDLLMSYEEAWPILRKGGRPSASHFWIDSVRELNNE